MYNRKKQEFLFYFPTGSLKEFHRIYKGFIIKILARSTYTEKPQMSFYCSLSRSSFLAGLS